MDTFITWNEDKNILLKKERWIGFEDVLLAMEEERMLDIIPHHNREKYPNQYIYHRNIGLCLLCPIRKRRTRSFPQNYYPEQKA